MKVYVEGPFLSPLLGPATIGTVSTRPACCRGQSRQPHRNPPLSHVLRALSGPQRPMSSMNRQKQPERDSKSSEGLPGLSSKERRWSRSVGRGDQAWGTWRAAWMLAQTLPHGKDIHCFLKVFTVWVHDPTVHLSAHASLLQ